MFGPLGVPELIFILILALLIFGPKRLPEIGRTLGRGMAEFRKASTELKRTINTELALDELSTAPPAAPQVPAPVWPARTEPPALTAARAPQAAVSPVEPEMAADTAADVPAEEAAVGPPAANEPLEPR
jgi:sec-independent protein translocase protein TatA